MKVIRGAELTFQPASHEDATDPGVLKKVLAAKRDLLQGQVQMLNWSLLRAGKSFRRHYHEDMQEVFVILRGRVSVTVEKDSQQDTLELGESDVILIDPLEIHSMHNRGDQDVVYLVFGISTQQGGQTIVVDSA